ncbi:hypothetical protein [Algoriphagus sp.]|uniref:hypothetical protein n=1 Tax=Algoriphagus sp. TaxID=1872435 RepID=UPI0026202EFF|nr:hypothetical protein [Algoriphagus sp.]
MKIIKYSFGLLVGTLVMLSSCRDFVEPNIPYSEFDTGAYLRTIDRTSTTFNFFDLTNSNFALTLEAVDIEDGGTVETVEIRVRHRRLIPGVGLEFTPQEDVLVRTLEASDFAPNSESRFLRASFDIPASEAVEAVGLTFDELEGGDVFEFRLVLNDRFGRSFSTNNVTTNVAGAPFYDSPFQYNVSVVCPVGDDYAVGEYELTQTQGGADPFFGNPTRFVEETVTLEPVSGNATRRSFTVNYLGGFTTRTFTIEFSCGNIVKPEEGAGAGCTDTILWESDNSDLATYDISDDSVITIKFIDDVTGDCGVTSPVELTLTKVD